MNAPRFVNESWSHPCSNAFRLPNRTGFLERSLLFSRIPDRRNALQNRSRFAAKVNRSPAEIVQLLSGVEERELLHIYFRIVRTCISLCSEDYTDWFVDVNATEDWLKACEWKQYFGVCCFVKKNVYYIRGNALKLAVTQRVNTNQDQVKNFILIPRTISKTEYSLLMLLNS
ncbi:hypothetical protein AVEN_43522-1 [Araneus ventricosus]|uniref:Uncharacterized protein n=1 Tax=Araneus ventricosus TaxID=182803 RepID=A0A4Y2J769_ARAVE|nr:hypothetical protein AVEN_43522-1 [Araneus ventricosus]